MAIETFTSTQYDKQTAVPIIKLTPTDFQGQVESASFNLSFTPGDLDSEYKLIKFPGGAIKILSITLNTDRIGIPSGLDMGHLGYTAIDGKTEVPVDTEFFSDLAFGFDTSSSINSEVRIISRTIETFDGFEFIFSLVEDNGTFSGEMTGFITYVRDSN